MRARPSDASPSSGDNARFGRGMLQSHEEWYTRNAVLAETLSALRDRFAPAGAVRALDVGCQKGALTELWAASSSLRWMGIDPAVSETTELPSGVTLIRASAESLPFPDAHFDVVMLANVYEHILPDRRQASLREMTRVLAPRGVIVGQIPNPYFPIESHSRLPFMGWLPIRLQKAYWKLSPVAWEHDFFVVTLRDLRREATDVGLDLLHGEKFNYPLTVIPHRVRWAARLLGGPMRVVPWAWQFVLARHTTRAARR